MLQESESDPCRGLFAFIQLGHPLHEFLEARRRSLRYQLDGVLSTCHFVGSDLKLVRGTGSAWKPRRLVAHLGHGDLQHLWIWSDKADTETIHRFPDDPYLPGFGQWWAEPLNASGDRLSDIEVLRYVPTRRVTLKCRIKKSGTNIIMKFKRPSKAAHSADMLLRVYNSTEKSGCSFAVARPAGNLPRHAGFAQQFLAGTPFDADITDGTLELAMRKAGSIHAQIHRMDVPGVPLWSITDYATTIATDVAWIGFMMPTLAECLRQKLPALDAALKTAKGVREVFCHGDFVPGQILNDEGRLAVTDFDMVRRGVDLQEIGKWIASLKYHIPLISRTLAEDSLAGARLLRRAEVAYLDGYSNESRFSLDFDHLEPFVVAAEIHYLGVTLKKDRYVPALFAAARQRIEGH